MIDAGAAARTCYDELVSGAFFESTVEALETAQGRGLLPYWERLGGLVLRPVFVSERTYAEGCRSARVVGQAMLTAARRAAVDGPFRQGLGLSSVRAHAVGLDLHRLPEPLMGRIDGFLDATGTTRFLEYNAFPAGVPETDHFNHQFAGLPAMQALREQMPCRAIDMLPTHLDAARITLSRLGFRRPPVVGVVEREANVAAENQTSQVQSFASGAQAQGMQIEVAPPERFTYRSGRLYVNDRPVDFVTVSDFDTFEQMIVDQHPLLAAIADGTVHFVDGLSTSFLLLSKVLFAALSDPVEQAMFDRETVAVLNRCVPWTRRVGESWTTRGGQRIDLLPYVAARRESLVLKPAGGHGGAGVVLGWEVDAQTWSAALEAACNEPFVVQERVKAPCESVPVVRGRSLDCMDLRWDYCPFVWNASWSQGALVRASSTYMMNVGAGTGVDFPWFIVGDP